MNFPSAPPHLGDDKVLCEPFNKLTDFDYLYVLAQKYKFNKVPREIMSNYILKSGYQFWNCLDKKTRVKGGVVYLSFLFGLGYTLDAYKDDRLAKSLDNTADYSYRVGKLILTYFFNHVSKRIYTMHIAENRAAHIVCKRLGFRELREITCDFGKFILFVNEGGKYGA